MHLSPLVLFHLIADRRWDETQYYGTAAGAAASSEYLKYTTVIAGAIENQISVPHNEFN